MPDPLTYLRQKMQEDIQAINRAIKHGPENLRYLIQYNIKYAQEHPEEIPRMLLYFLSSGTGTLVWTFSVVVTRTYEFSRVVADWITSGFKN